jgi:hypothetical protein
MVAGSLWVLQLLPPLKLVAMILLNVALNKINQINQSIFLLQDKDLNYLLHGEKKKIRVLSLFDGIGTGIAYQLS